MTSHDCDADEASNECDADEELALEMIKTQNFQPIGSQKRALEKLCCSLTFDDDTRAFFTLDVQDWFAKHCFQMCSRFNLHEENALESTNAASRFFAKLFVYRRLAAVACFGAMTNVLVLSYETIELQMMSDWLREFGTRDETTLYRGDLCVARVSMLRESARRPCPSETIKRNALREWTLIKQTIERYCPAIGGKSVKEIKLGAFQIFQTTAVFGNAFDQALVERQSEIEWRRGMRLVQNGLMALVDAASTAAAEWQPTLTRQLDTVLRNESVAE